ncbi:MAG: helix-hairpin-helix domain-containing protein [Atribacterota bacterium]
MFNLSRQEKIVFLIIILALLITFSWKLYSREKSSITIVPTAEIGENDNREENEIIDKKICIVHISGAVKQPGVYELTEGERIIDAVKMAGGEMEGANMDAVNLAAHLYDGQKIVIPFISENNVDEVTQKDIANEELRQPDYSVNSSLLNLNAVTSNQLESLPGIGPALAERILAYRKDHGLFKNIEDVMNVSGIGEKRFESIKEYITVY